MSRSVLFVAGALVSLGVLAWLLTSTRQEPVTPPEFTAAPGIQSPADPTPAKPGATAEIAPPVAGAPPRVTNRDELVLALKARGLDADRLIARYQDWRVERGFLGPDPLAGVSADDSLLSVYATMDRATLRSLADSGDLGAMQAYAEQSRTDDPATAIDYYRRASELGSAAAMAGIAGILADIGALPVGEAQKDQALASRVLALRGGDPARDLRRDSVAWTLASIRQYGPILATPAGLAMAEEFGRSPDKAMLTGICSQSLAILGVLSAATADKDASGLPPVFVTEKGLYERLPCRDTPAPVTPPRALDACTSSPATGSNNRPVELWICPGN